MKQGVLPFQYEQEKSSPGMTAMAGMMTYLELMHAAGLRSSVERHVGLRECGQGWTDSQVVSSLILLNLAGGESVVDLDVVEKDAGLCRVLREVESYGMGRRERRALEERWRVERRRSMPSESAVFRYLERFHEAGEESSREAHRAFIPSPNEALGGLHKVNADMVSFVQSRSPCAQATLDMDATLVETHKQQALYSYKKYKAYQPLTTYWAEAELIVHSEFRDGNVPAGYQQLRVLTEALEHLPCAVDKVMLRSDAAGYQHELLRYCAEGRDERFGVIEFAVGLNVTPEFRRAVSEVAEQDWHAPHRRLGATWVETGQQWAVSNARNYVPVDREIARNYRPLRQVIDHPVRRIGDHCCILDVRSSNGVQGGVESGDSRSGAALAVRHQPARYINWYGAVARDSAQVHRGGRGGGSGPGRSCSE